MIAMKMHKVLLRQLSRYQLQHNQCPQDIKQWQEFLRRINLTYEQQDQDRYLAGRTQEIFSQEMRKLLDELEEAQSIAHLGSWTLDMNSHKMMLSKEAYQILGIDHSLPFLTYKQFIKIIHPDDQNKFVQSIIHGYFLEEMNFRLLVNKQIRWIEIFQRQIKNQEKSTNKKIGIILDITRIKHAQEREFQLNKKLVIAAKEAGRAEVSTSVLHNVGNILNSVNVTVNLLIEKLHSTKTVNLKKIVTLYHQHTQDLANFITSDPKGRHIFSYLEKLTDYLEKEQSEFLTELKMLDKNVNNIKNVIIRQQSLSKVGIIRELYSPKEIIDEAIQICSDFLLVDQINVIRDYEMQENILGDPSMLQQIMVNLIRNSRDALVKKGNNFERQIIIRLLNKSKSIEIQVTDNGIGMDSKTLEKIFTFGFTTKEHGHGFGLHSSWLIAKSMNGLITANSDGINQGSTFTLIAPKTEKTINGYTNED